MKNYLFIFRHPPHRGCKTQELLDMVLTSGAFDQAVSLLFLDDGVLELKKSQRPAKSGVKDTLAIFKALELYEITELYADAEALQERGLKREDLVLPVKLLFRQEIHALLQRFAIIV